MALTPAEIAEIVTALRASGVEAPSAPAEQPVSPAEEMKTPVQRLLAGLRLDETPNQLAVVEAWIDANYGDNTTEPGAPVDFTRTDGVQAPDPGFPT
jgi:hypothetical protein